MRTRSLIFSFGSSDSRTAFRVSAAAPSWLVLIVGVPRPATTLELRAVSPQATYPQRGEGRVNDEQTERGERERAPSRRTRLRRGREPRPRGPSVKEDRLSEKGCSDVAVRR